MEELRTPLTINLGGVEYKLVQTETAVVVPARMLTPEQLQVYIQIGTTIYSLAVAAINDIKAAFGQNIADEVLARLDEEYARRIALNDAPLEGVPPTEG